MSSIASHQGLPFLKSESFFLNPLVLPKKSVMNHGKFRSWAELFRQCLIPEFIILMLVFCLEMYTVAEWIHNCSLMDFWVIKLGEEKSQNVEHLQYYICYRKLISLAYEKCHYFIGHAMYCRIKFQTKTCLLLGGDKLHALNDRQSCLLILSRTWSINGQWGLMGINRD